MQSKRFTELSTILKDGRYTQPNTPLEIDEKNRETVFAAKEAQKLKSERARDIPRQKAIVKEYIEQLEAEKKAEKKARELARLQAEADRAAKEAKEAEEARKKAELAAKEAKASELAAKEAKEQLIARFKACELDENAIKRLQKAYGTGKPLEEIYQRFHELTKWALNKGPAVQELLTNLGLTDFTVPSISNKTDYFYALMFKVIRDGKSFAEAKSELAKLQFNCNSFTLIGCQASGIREEVIEKLSPADLLRIHPANFACLALPIKIYLASYLISNKIDSADWSNLLSELSHCDDIDSVEKRIQQLQKRSASPVAAEIKQAPVRRGDAFVAPDTGGVLALNAENADPEPRLSNLIPGLFNQRVPISDVGIARIMAVDFMAIKMHLHRDGRASINVIHGIMIGVRGHHHIGNRLRIER